MAYDLEEQEQIETLKADLAAISSTLSGLVKSGVREGRSKVERTADYYKQQGMEQADAAMDEARAYGEMLLEEFLKRIPEFHLAGPITWSEGSVRGPRRGRSRRPCRGFTVTLCRSSPRGITTTSSSRLTCSPSDLSHSPIRTSFIDSPTSGTLSSMDIKKILERRALRGFKVQSSVQTTQFG